MPKIKKILFAIELADISSDIAPWVNLMAEKFEAEIDLFHVVPDMAYTWHPYVVGAVMDMGAMMASAKEKVAEFHDKHIKSSHPSTISIVSGDAAVRILEQIEKNDISIVIMGTRGRSGLSRAVFGSVADRVLRASPVPVFCVNPAEAETAE